jgi:heat shock protein HslJ
MDHAPELDGTWLVTSYLDDEEMTVPDHRAEAYMSIDGDHVSGTMGLNRFMGQMQDGLPGQNLAVTRMSGPPELMRQEDILLGHLMGTDTIEVVEEGMTMSREGLTLVELRRRGTESPEPSS